MSSCLIASYRRFIDMNDDEERLLKALEFDPRTFKRGAQIAEQGSPADLMHVISEGWCYNQVCDGAGHCQTLDIHLPGDLSGVREVGFTRRLSSLHAASDVTVCPFPRARLTDLFAQSPRLSAVFVMISMRREAILSERIFGLGRRDARSRVCHFVHELSVRLGGRCTEDTETFDCPLTQQQIADALGLTPVHLSRVLRELRESGVMELRDRQVLIHNHPRLQGLALLNENYLDMNADWVHDFEAVSV